MEAAGIVPFDAESRFLVERASGYGPDEWAEVADLEPPARAETRLWQMVDRRVDGEPLQYVLGAWGFRGLDLMVDRRVLIPRPETETVVEVALEEAARLGLRRVRRRLSLVGEPTEGVVADLGTGSGAIALALEAELPDVEVWAVDASDEALEVARANVAGCAATRVRIAEAGSWFEPLPPELRGRLQVVVSNPPYIAAHELPSLPDEVAQWEPRDALIAGEEGTESIARIVSDAVGWLTMPGALVIEIAPHQDEVVVELARAAGFGEAFVRDDLTGRPRVLVARTG